MANVRWPADPSSYRMSGDSDDNEKKKKKKKTTITYNDDSTITVHGASSREEAVGAYLEERTKKLAQDKQDYKTAISQYKQKNTAENQMWNRGSNAPRKDAYSEATKKIVAARRNTKQKKQELEDYKQERKQTRATDWQNAYQKAQAETSAATPMEGISDEDALIQQIQDTNRKARQNYDQELNEKKAAVSQAEKEQNQATMESGLESISRLSEEGQKKLDEYNYRMDTASDPLATGLPELEAWFAENEHLDKDAVEKLAEVRRRDTNAQKAAEQQQAAQEAADAHPVWNSTLTVPANLIGGSMASLGYLGEALNGTGQFTDLDPYNQGAQLQNWSGAVRGEVKQNIQGDGSDPLRAIAAGAYDVGMGMADTGARMALGTITGGGSWLGAGIAGANNFGSAMQSAASRGANADQALLYATASATVDALTEKIPLDNLINISTAKGGAGYILNFLRSMGIEGGQEAASQLASLFADAAIMRDKSERNLAVAQMMTMNPDMSLEEAQAAADRDIVNNILYSMTVSGFAGGFNSLVATTKYKLAHRGENADAQAVSPQPAQEAVEAPDSEKAAPLDGEQMARALADQAQPAGAADALAAARAQAEAERAAQTQAPTESEAAFDQAFDRVMNQDSQTPAQESQKPGSQAEAPKTDTDAEMDRRARMALGMEDFSPEDYEKNVADAVRKQRQVVADAGVRASQAQADYDAGKITEAQKDNEQRSYFIADERLKELRHMTQEEYDAYLEDFFAYIRQPETAERAATPQTPKAVTDAGKPQNIQGQGETPKTEMERRARMALGMEDEKPIDNGTPKVYDNSNSETGGMNDAGAGQLQGTDGERLPGGNETGRVPGSGDGTLRVPGQAPGGMEAGAEVVPGSVQGKPGGSNTPDDLRVPGELRVSDALTEAQQKKGTPTYPVKDTTTDPGSYEQALTAGRNSDPQNGWCVTPKSAQELKGGKVRTFMDENGTVGVGVAPDGDIVGVFKNKNGGPKKALDTMMPIAIEQGGDRLDCYGEGLVNLYAKYGFEPVARVEFNPEYANEGWTPDKGTPYIYVMKHNGDSADAVVDKMGTYPEYTDAQLNALPTYGKDDYDGAMAYRDSLMQQSQPAAQPEAQQEQPAAQSAKPVQQQATPQGVPQEAQGGAQTAETAGQAQTQGGYVPGAQASAEGDNVQRSRPGDVRPMEVPKTDQEGKRVTEFAGNAYGAQATPDSMAEEIKTLANDGSLSFDTRTNRQSLEQAADYIGKRGADTVRGEITARAASGKMDDGDIEKAMLLYTRYANDDSPKSQEAASEMMVALSSMANKTGRNLQMFGMMRKMTPEGQLMTVEKTVEQNVKRLQQRGRVKKDYVSDGVDAELEADYLKAAKKAKKATDPEAQKAAAKEMRAAEDAIYKAEAAKMPATFAAKWNAWRYMSMMGNVRTNVRNIEGNAAFMPYKIAKDKLGALAEKVLLPKDQRTKSLVQDADLLAWAKEDTKTDLVQDALQYTGLLGDDASTQKLEEGKRVFKNNALEGYRKLAEELPAKGDALFKNSYYARSLAGFLKARGISVDDITSGNVDQKILTEARNYSINEAMKATFNDANALSDFVSNIGRSEDSNPVAKVANAMMEGVLPFRRTPANIIVRFKDYSPIGMLQGVWDAAKNVKAGKITAAGAIDEICAGVTGTGAMMLGYAMAKGMGGVKLTGSDVDEDEKRQGHQQYALEFSIGGQEYSYKIDWAAPANLPLFVGANVAKMLEDGGNDADVSTFSKFLTAGKGMFEPMLELSMLSSLNELLSSGKYTGESGLYQIATGMITSYLTQAVPAILRQADTASQKYAQTTYANSADPNIRELQRTAANLPFVGRAFKTDKVDAWGEKVDNGSAAVRAFNAFVNPGTLKKIQESPLEQEISRLNGTQESNVSPDSVPRVVSYTDTDGEYIEDLRLTDDQYEKWATTQGQTARRIQDDLVKNPDYQNLSDKQKAEALNLAKEYAKEQGKRAALAGYPETGESWMIGIDGKEAAAIVDKVNAGTLQNAIAGLSEAMKNDWNTGNREKTLEEGYSAYEKMDAQTKARVAESVSGDTARYLEAREAGVSTTAYLKVLDAVKHADGTGNSATYRAITSASISDSAMDKLMKAYMPDYDPENPKSDKSELKYDYARKELGMSPAEYAKAYEIYQSFSNYGKGKAKKQRAALAELYGEDMAKKLYKLYGGKLDVVDWWEDQQ